MKTFLSITLFMLCSIAMYAQNEFTLTIKTTKGKTMPNVDVTATNGDLNITEKTDATGKAVFTLTEPGMYIFSYLDEKNAAKYEVKEGFRGSGSSTSTYDPKGIFADKPNADRKGITFKSISAQALKGKPKVAQITVNVKEHKGAKVGYLEFDIVSCVDKAKYSGKTNAAGLAVFYLPINRDYEVDIDGIEAISKFSVPNYENLRMSPTVYYEKTKLDQITKGDTIIQRNITQTLGTSSHVLFLFTLKDYSGNPLEGEPVFAKAENGDRVFEGVTDDKGECKLMLKKGDNYIINLKYEDGVHYVEATDKKGFAYAGITRRYRGSRAIEEMIAEQERQAKAHEKGFVTEHRQTPIRTAAKPTDYLTKTATGFDLDFKSSGPVGTPTIAEDKLFTQAGFYSPNFYCLQANTGHYLWGVELGESGISPAVYSNGVILINTYSCTLYAIDAKTGDLLWSKWLAGTVYSTPSADGDKVYVVYNNGGTNPENHDESYVIACFDLRTGSVQWMNWVDRKVIACPVVDGNEVHVASQSGNYYVYDTETGDDIINTDKIHAVSSPTITPDKIYITAMVKGKESLVTLGRKTLAIKNNFGSDLTSTKINETGGAYGQMNYNGAHPIVYKNEAVIVLDTSQIIAFNPITEKLLWKQDVRTNPNQIPIVANGRVIVATTDGKVISYNISTGIPRTLQRDKGEIEGQPISHKGFLYIATAGVVSVIKSIQKLDWTQWNKDATHNAYWR